MLEWFVKTIQVGPDATHKFATDLCQKSTEVMHDF